MVSGGGCWWWWVVVVVVIIVVVAAAAAVVAAAVAAAVVAFAADAADAAVEDVDTGTARAANYSAIYNLFLLLVGCTGGLEACLGTAYRQE